MARRIPTSAWQRVPAPRWPVRVLARQQLAATNQVSPILASWSLLRCMFRPSQHELRLGGGPACIKHDHTFSKCQNGNGNIFHSGGTRCSGVFVFGCPAVTAGCVTTTIPRPAYCISSGCMAPCWWPYKPVCGADGRTYMNECRAACRGVEVVDEGTCRSRSNTGSLQRRTPGLCHVGWQHACWIRLQ